MPYYSYNGPVFIFDKCVKDKWKAETYANSPEKAKSNLCFRYKKEFRLRTDCKLSLPGRLTIGKE